MEVAPLSREPVENTATDADLLGRTAAGDRLAFRTLHRRYEAYAFWLARRMLGRSADAEDAVQEAWIRVFRRANGSVPADRVRAWLRTVVVRCCLDRHRRVRGEEVDGNAAPPGAVHPGPPGLRVDLERALAALTWDLRAVVVLHDVEGLSHGEVAGVLDISEQASRSRLARARRQLRSSLGTS